MARAAAALPRVRIRGSSDILREGLAKYFLDGNAAALPTLRRAVEPHVTRITIGETS